MLVIKRAARRHYNRDVDSTRSVLLRVEFLITFASIPTLMLFISFILNVTPLLRYYAYNGDQ